VYLRRNPFRAEEMHKTRLSKIEAIGEKIEKANRYLYEHKRAKIATQIRHIKKYIVKLKLDGLLDVEADEGKKQYNQNGTGSYVEDSLYYLNHAGYKKLARKVLSLLLYFSSLLQASLPEKQHLTPDIM